MSSAPKNPTIHPIKRTLEEREAMARELGYESLEAMYWGVQPTRARMPSGEIDAVLACVLAEDLEAAQ